MKVKYKDNILDKVIDIDVTEKETLICKKDYRHTKYDENLKDNTSIISRFLYYFKNYNAWSENPTIEEIVAEWKKHYEPIHTVEYSLY